MHLTDLVADLAHLLQSPGGEVEFLSRFRMDGVDHQVGVEVLGVHMSGDQDLAAGEELLRQLEPELVRLGRGEIFFRREGLDILVEEGAGVLSVEVFGSHETLHGHIRHTVDAGEIAPAVLVHCLFGLGHIPDHPAHAPDGLLARLDEATGRHGTSPDLSPPAGRRTRIPYPACL